MDELAEWTNAVIEQLRHNFSPAHWLVVLYTAMHARGGDLYNVWAPKVSQVSQLPVLSDLREPTLQFWCAAHLSSEDCLLSMLGIARQLDCLLANDASELKPQMGFDGKEYCIVRRGFVLAERSGLVDQVSPYDQGGGIESFFPGCHVLPTDTYLIRELSKREHRALSVIRENALGEVGREEVQVRLMAATPIGDYSSQIRKTGRGNFHMRKVSDAGSSASITAEFVELVRRAREKKAAVLVLPELSVGPDQLEAIEAELRRHGDFPVLTVLGLVHSEEPAGSSGESYVNEALILGSAGNELLRYRKRRAVAVPRTPQVPRDLPLNVAEWDLVRDRFSREATHVAASGSKFPLLDSPLGLIAVTICLDLFAKQPNRTISDAGPALLLVPSLSPTVSPHRRAAEVFSGQDWCITVVANRPFGATVSDREKAPSFVRSQSTQDATEPEYDSVIAEI